MTDQVDLERADALLAVNRPQEALPLLARAVAAEPAAARPRCLMAVALLRMGRTTEALDVARQASGAEPDNEWALRLQAVALIRRHRPGEACRLAEAAVRLAPTSWQTHVTLADALVARKRLPQAEAAAAEAVRLAPARAETHVAASTIALRRSQWTNAEVLARRALAIEPDNLGGATNLSVALRRQGRDEEAIGAALAATRIDPGSSAGHGTFQAAVDEAVKPRPWELLAVLAAGLALAATHNAVMFGLAALLLPAAVLWFIARRTRRLHPDARRIIALRSAAARADPVGVLARRPGAPGILVGCGAFLCVSSPILLSGSAPVAWPVAAVMASMGAAALYWGLAAVRRARSSRARPARPGPG